MPKSKRGRSHSVRPIGQRSPSWCRYTPEEVEALVVKLAKEGNPSSRIGVILRDQYGIPLVKMVVGKGVGEVLRENELAPTVPEDLGVLLRKATRLHAHLERNKADQFNKRSLEVVEAKIHRLSRHYKSKGVLPADWKYTPTALATA